MPVAEADTVGVSLRMRPVCRQSSSTGVMMAEVVAVDDVEIISSVESGSAQHSPDFRDPLGVNDHLCTAVDDESDEFDFDVSCSLMHLDLDLDDNRQSPMDITAFCCS